MASVTGIVQNAPMALGIKLIKDAVEEGRDLPPVIQFCDTVGAGMALGLGSAPVLHSVSVIQAINHERQFHGTTAQAIHTFVKEGRYAHITPSFGTLSRRMFMKGTKVGAVYFIGEQVYKKLIK